MRYNLSHIFYFNDHNRILIVYSSRIAVVYLTYFLIMAETFCQLLQLMTAVENEDDIHEKCSFFSGRQRKEKERKRICIAPFMYYVYLKALRHGSHSFTCKYTMPAFPSYAFTRWRHL